MVAKQTRCHVSNQRNRRTGRALASSATKNFVGLLAQGAAHEVLL